MKLINEKLPNHKLALGKEVFSTDEKGILVTRNQDLIKCLLMSGFTKLEADEDAEKIEAPFENPEPPVADEVEELSDEDAQDLADAEEALAEVEVEGTVSLEEMKASLKPEKKKKKKSKGNNPWLK